MGERGELDKAVQRFREIAENVPPTNPATAQQREEARSDFSTILRILAPDRYRTPQELIAAKAIDRFRDYQLESGYLTDVKYRFDNDDGELTILIWLVLRDRLDVSAESLAKMKELRSHLDKWLTYYGVESWPVVSFRSETEQGRLETAPTS